MNTLIGVDIGGTFTDIVGVDLEKGQIWTHKVQTTPEDHTNGFLNGLHGILKKMEKSVEEVDYIFHGTTVGTNAILEKKGAKIGLLTTEGFEDILYIGRQKRSDMYNLFMDPETPVFLAPRHRIKGIKERVDSNGDILTPINENEILEKVRDLVENYGVKSIAVNFMFSFANSEHEKIVERIIKKNYPNIYVSLSSSVDPQFREYERCCLTAFDAYVKPVMGNYLEKVQSLLKEDSIECPLYVMVSHGGISGVRRTIERAVGTVLSGVAAGVLGGRNIGAQVGDKNIITLDVGGTSADVSLIMEGKPILAMEGSIDSYPLRQSMVDVNTIGAGGGSIAYVDEAGNLKVGPSSAGALPGPAAYGRGGAQPTVTDASIVLGYISPKSLAGGNLSLNEDLAKDSIEKYVCRPLNINLVKAASGIHQIINASMADAVRLVSVKKGYDPRDFSLLAFGGAGAIHVCSVASQLGVKRIIIPPSAGVLSAYGLLVADIESQELKTFKVSTKNLKYTELISEITKLENKCLENMKVDGIDEVTGVTREYVAMMRYVGQSYDLQVHLSLNENNQDVITNAVRNFHSLHEQVHGQSDLSNETEITSLRVTTKKSIAKNNINSLNQKTHNQYQSVEYREVYFEEYTKYVKTPVYNRYSFPKDKVISGPAIITETDSTTVVSPGWSVKLTNNDSFILEFIE